LWTDGLFINNVLIPLGIALCLSRSATFSGPNLAVLSLIRVHFEAAVEIERQNPGGSWSCGRMPNTP